MLEKNAKISVLRTMIGLGEEIEPHFIVPQNSISNIGQKMILGERPTVNTPPTLIPLENSLRSTQPATVKCAHCENMAKNFLYLESLIRNNYNPKSQCGLCYSSLKYLQYVNKSIMQVFGNFESIAQAAKAFTNNQPRPPIPRTVREIAAKSTIKAASKKNVEKKRLKGGERAAKVSKVTRPVLQKRGRSVSTVRLAGGGKLAKPPRSHPSSTKNKTKNKNTKAAKAKVTSAIEIKRTKKPASTKQKCMKAKRKRIGTVRLSIK